MALNAKNIPNTNKGGFVQPELEPGNYPARVVQILDMGLQPQRAFKGKEKPPAYMINITYELVDAFMEDEDGNELEDKPRWVSEMIALHNLNADLAISTKRYRALDPDEVFEGDFSKLLDTPCNVTITINKKDGKVYTNIANVGPMRPRDAAKCPELVNEPKFFDLETPDLEVFNSLPEWIQEKIKTNLEFKGSPLEGLLGDNQEEDKPEEEAPKKRRGRKPKEEEPEFDPDENDEGSPY